MARGKAEEGKGARCSRGWFGRGRRTQESEEGRVASRRRSRAGAEVSNVLKRDSEVSLCQ